METKQNYMMIPTPAIIFFCLLLLGIAFYAGTAFNKLKNTTSTTTPNTTNTTAKTVFAAVKNDKPELDFYVMSFCPYGNQIEQVLRPVFDLLGNKVSLQPRYIFEKITDLAASCKSRSGDPSQCSTYVTNKYFKDEAECKKVIAQNLATCLDPNSYIKSGNNFYSSLHGRQEANQDVREICAWNSTDDKKKWWDFVGNVNQSCTAQNADSCWEEQAKKAGLDTGKISECFNKDAIALIDKEIEFTDKNQVSGSPTVLLNGVAFPPEAAYTQDGTGNLGIGQDVVPQAKYRTPDVLKLALCASFNKAPGECKTTLAEPAAAAGAAAAGDCN